MESTHRGACLCGRISFTVAGPLGASDACHCTQCRKQSGQFFASVNVPRSALALTGAEYLTWF
jgi:hypothetical protein